MARIQREQQVPLEPDWCCWQHSCGLSRPRSSRDPTPVYELRLATALQLNETAQSPQEMSSKEYKIVALRQCPVPEAMHLCDRDHRAAEYWSALHPDKSAFQSGVRVLRRAHPEHQRQLIPVSPPKPKLRVLRVVGNKCAAAHSRRRTATCRSPAHR